MEPVAHYRVGEQDGPRDGDAGAEDTRKTRSPRAGIPRLLGNPTLREKLRKRAPGGGVETRACLQHVQLQVGAIHSGKRVGPFGPFEGAETRNAALPRQSAWRTVLPLKRRNEML